MTRWQQWDTGWFLGIAAHGYQSPASFNFYPLYPLLIAAVSLPLGGVERAGLLSALLVNNLGALLGFVMVARLAAREVGGEQPAWRSLAFLAAYPWAYFLFAGYSEGLFVGFAAGALYCARAGRWRWAFLAGLAAGLTRVSGLVLILPVAYEAYRQGGRSRFAAALGPPLAFLGFGAFAWARFGDPLLFVHTQATYWHRHLSPPWRSVELVADAVLRQHSYVALFDLAAVLGVLAVTLAALRWQAFSLTLYNLGLVVLVAAAPGGGPSPLVSAGRLLLPALPVFLALARWCARRPGLELSLLAGGFVLQALFALNFLAGGEMH